MGHRCRKYGSHSIPISMKNRLMKAIVWSVETYGCESWALRNNEETRLDAFEMEGLRKILRVSWSAKKSNEWVLNKAGVKKEGTVRHRQSNEASILWSHHEETRELPGERDNARNNARCTQARTTSRPGQSEEEEESVRMRDHREIGESTSVVWPTL